MTRLHSASNWFACVYRLTTWLLVGIGLLLPQAANAQTATWTPAGNMSTARVSHTATLLNDGTVLVAGGWVNATAGPTASTEIYNPSTNSWTVVGSMANARYNHTATLLTNGEVLVAGGDATGVSAEVYNPSTKTWTVTGSMIDSRYGHSASLLSNGMVLVAGGCCTSGSVAGYSEPVSEAWTSAELFNPATGTWTLTGSMINMHAFHTANVLSTGNALVEGGTSLQLPAGPEVIGASEVYNPGTAVWTAVGNLNTARYAAASSLFTGDQVLVAGGDGGGCCSGLTSAELYATASQSWQATASMSVGAYSLASALLSTTESLVSGGYSCCSTPQSTSNAALIYNLATHTWSITASMSQARYGHTLTMLSDGTVLAAGGTYTGLNGAGITSAERFYNGTPPPMITISSNVATMVFNVTGTGCAAGSYLTPTTLAWTSGASCTVQVAPSTPYEFESWSDGSTANPRTFVAPSTNTTYSFTVSNGSSAAASISANGGTPQSAPVGTAFASPLVALVQDNHGNPVNGVIVTFTAPSSGASGSFAGGTNTAVTNSSGLATAAAFTANSISGSYRVAASVPGVSGTARFRLTNEAAAGASSITTTSGTPQTATVGTAFANPLVVTVKNSSGGGVSGVTVTFAAPSSGASGTFAGGANTATTNASGVATSAAFTANSTAGSYAVTASAPGVSTPASFALTNQASTGPSSIAATSGTPQTATISKAFGSPLIATVLNSSGTGVSGVTVTFTVPSSGASGTFAGSVNTATTNSSGVAASAIFTANSVAGSYTVTASVSGVSKTASFALTNQAGSPASISATGGTPQSATVSTAFAAPLSATVKDSGGNAVSGVSVTFAAPGSGASGSFAGGVNTATTNSSGVATSAIFTANSTGGTYTVTASVSGVSTTASFALTNSAPSAAGSTITLVPSSYVTAQGTTGGQAVASSLDVLDESGTQNVWNKYVEFDGLYSGYQIFTLPSTVAVSSVTNMQVQVNYQGPSSANQTWTWSIYNWSSAAYVTLGTNAGATEWGAWKILTFTVPGTLANYVNASTGQIRIQLSSNNSSDAVDIDYEAVVVTY
jgi:hypothetical protein